MIPHMTSARKLWLVALLCLVSGLASGQEPSSKVGENVISLSELKALGASRSSYKHQTQLPLESKPQPALATFRDQIQPALQQTCVECHGPKAQEGNMRIDTLDPDLMHGQDVTRWLEVFAVVSNGEMPPPDAPKLADQQRSDIVQWLSLEIQKASAARRAEQSHSSFRRMTRYETNYALQDLFGVPYNFTNDLPPESASEDGFQNSSELLHMSVNQLATYRELALTALKKVTVGKEQPPLIYWGISMKDAASQAWAQHEKELENVKRKHKDNPETLQRELDKRTAAARERPGATHYKNLSTGQSVRAHWDYGGAKYARQPSATKPEVPTDFEQVAIVPPRQRLVVELGDTIPEAGTLRVRVRAARVTRDQQHSPSLQLEFGWQASNDSQASVRISQRDLVIDAPPEQPQFYQWDVPLCEVQPRNSMRKVWKMGDLPNPSEFLRLVNSSASPGDIQIDYVEVTAPVYDQWPPAEHTRVFIDSVNKADENLYAQEILQNFLRRTWRHQPTADEVVQKVALFKKIRPECEDFEQAMTEVLAGVLASPKFLYITAGESANTDSKSPLTQTELAARLSMFLWCSLPDDELLGLAIKGELRDEVLTTQVNRLLSDPRSRRLAEQFVHQWLGMQLLDFLKVDDSIYPRFDPALKEAMQEEPVAFFQEVLEHNHSVLDFLHADYALVNERLAQHYGMADVYGNEFRKVSIDNRTAWEGRPTVRGGLLTQAGLLAMNSDGKDSHPLKRGIWMLKSLLNDPPPPPPPAVPTIDLADPEIAKMTIKQRIENHRNQPACYSCHAKIDPWGIAFENFDAVGRWRTEIQGKPVDATSILFNGQKLDGIDALKRFLLEHRQDQFARAMVHKMLTFALGRPLTFGDRASVDKITADLRTQGDGLATMIKLIATSDVFH